MCPGWMEEPALSFSYRQGFFGFPDDGFDY